MLLFNFSDKTATRPASSAHSNWFTSHERYSNGFCRSGCSHNSTIMFYTSIHVNGTQLKRQDFSLSDKTLHLRASHSSTAPAVLVEGLRWTHHSSLYPIWLQHTPHNTSACPPKNPPRQQLLHFTSPTSLQPPPPSTPVRYTFLNILYSPRLSTCPHNFNKFLSIYFNNLLTFLPLLLN